MNEENSDLEKKGVEHLQERIAESPLLNVEHPKHWLVLYCILGLLTVLILWSFLGRIPTEASGKSVSISACGVFLVESPSPGTLTELFVSEGGFVRKGEPLAKFNNPKLNSLITAIEATKFKIERLQTQSLLLQKALSINIGLFKQGLIAKMVIDQSRSNVMEKNIEVEDAKSSLSNFFTDLENNAFVDQGRFNHYKKLLRAPPDVIEFSKVLDELSILRAPEDGKVLEVLSNQGEIIQTSESIFWMEHPPPEKDGSIFYGTVDSQTRGRMRPGLKVLIEPANVNPKEYGAIIGKVEKIYPYPVSKEELLQTVGNKQIVSFLVDEGGVMTQVTVTPRLDSRTTSGYKWTSRKGPPYEIPTGTIAKMRIIVEEQPPISYLIPLWKIKPL